MSSSWWKVRRELRRVAGQLLEPYRQLRDAILRVDYRIRHTHHVQHFDGLAAWTDRIAVFLVHQPKGLPQSILTTCEHLRVQGYACVMVSNGALTGDDLTLVLPIVSHVIVRPNFGYDFGGYQEAVFWLRQTDVDLKHLLLINDSVWFPVLSHSSFLMQMEKTGADVVGALSAQRGSAQRHQRKLFYASFMLLFSGKVWRSRKFENFWKNYRQTSSKPRTIRKGERKLSALFIHDEEFTHHAMVNSETYQDLSHELTASTWPSFAKELGLINPSFDRQRQALLLSSGPDVEEAWRDWYRRLCESENMFTCAQASLVLRSGVPFIKKSKDPHNMLVLQQSVGAFCHEVSFDAVVSQEIHGHVDNYYRCLKG